MREKTLTAFDCRTFLLGKSPLRPYVNKGRRRLALSRIFITRVALDAV